MKHSQCRFIDNSITYVCIFAQYLIIIECISFQCVLCFYTLYTATTLHIMTITLSVLNPINFTDNQHGLNDTHSPMHIPLYIMIYSNIPTEAIDNPSFTSLQQLSSNCFIIDAQKVQFIYSNQLDKSIYQSQSITHYLSIT